MFRSDLKALSAQLGLTVSGSLAHGYLSGCRVTLSMLPRCIRMHIYIGALDTVPEGSGQQPRLYGQAQAVSQIIRGGVEESALATPDGVTIDHNASIVSVDFARTPSAGEAITRFAADVMPRITPLTLPMQCIHCGGYTAGQGVPVDIGGKCVVPMHTACFADCSQRYEAAKAAASAGQWDAGCRAIIAAALGAVLACGAWLLLHSNLWTALLLTLLTVALVYGAYWLMKGPGGLVRAVTLGTGSGLAILLGMMGNALLPLHQRYAAYGDVVHGMMREGVFLRVELGKQLSGGSLLWMLLACLVLAGVCIAAILILQTEQQEGKQAHRPKALPGQA